MKPSHAAFADELNAIIEAEGALGAEQKPRQQAGRSASRTVLFSALAWAEVPLTWDEGDFGGFMEQPFYGLRVLRPGVFLERERAAGRI